MNRNFVQFGHKKIKKMQAHNASEIKKIWLRVLVVYTINLVIKAFDTTFGGFFDFTSRGTLFSIFFLSYWLGIWYIIDYAQTLFLNKIRKKYIHIGFHILFSYSSSLIFNILYMYLDINFYENRTSWTENSVLNPELTMSLTVLYILIYISHQYFQSNLMIKESQLKAKTLEKETISAQYMALKAQIEPHFLFNSLSVLSSIVYKDADLANEFIVKLSKTLRYVIEKNEYKLVKLSEEMNIVNNYIFLLKVRFGEAIQLINHLPNHATDTIYIPPVGLQMLVENAILHNKFSISEPLIIQITMEDEAIKVSNNISKREQPENSTKQGLKNLSQRYKLLCNKDIRITENEFSYNVEIPAINNENYESFNI